MMINIMPENNLEINGYAKYCFKLINLEQKNAKNAKFILIAIE